MSEELTKVVVDLSKPKGHPERVQSIPLTAEEIAENDIMAAQSAIERAERDSLEQAKAEAKASAESKLAALGLTSEEVAAIVGA